MRQSFILHCLAFVLITQLVLMSCKRTSVDSDLTERMRYGLDILCPGVDICGANTSGASLNRNKVVGKNDYISCCRGCSCNKKCHYFLNCCFPNDENFEEEILLDNTTNRIRGDSFQDDAFTSTAENFLSAKECIYIQTGTPDSSWVADVESYRMISKPPIGGCFPKSLSTLDSACTSDSVAPWGNLYPVYSRNQKQIYKNRFCARCHGDEEFDFWTPVLVCDRIEGYTGRFVSISEHLFSLQNAEFSSNCKVWFLYEDDTVLKENRCFVDFIRNCSEKSDQEAFDIPPGLNMTSNEITNACHSGLFSPLIVWGKVYLNVFCAVCNYVVYVSKVLYCPTNVDKYKDLRSFGKNKMAYLLESAVITESILRKASQRSTPKACLHQKPESIEEKCREIYCPSGQMRNDRGICVYPGREVYTEPMHLFIKLDYRRTNVSVISMLNKGLVTPTAILAKFRETSPWPSYWNIKGIFHSVDDEIVLNESSVIVKLETDFIRLDKITEDVKRDLTKGWEVVLNEQTFTFQQSFMKFSLKENEDETLFPSWKLEAESISSALRISLKDSRRWSPIIRTLVMRQSSMAVSILLTCDQVTLFEDEYMLSKRRLILLNKLEDRIMFDKEFELLMNDNGKLSPRVCISDTPLLLRTYASTGTKSRGFIFVVFFAAKLTF